MPAAAVRVAYASPGPHTSDPWRDANPGDSGGCDSQQEADPDNSDMTCSGRHAKESSKRLYARSFDRTFCVGFYRQNGSKPVRREMLRLADPFRLTEEFGYAFRIARKYSVNIARHQANGPYKSITVRHAIRANS